MSHVEGKVAIVTGAASGVGLASAKQLVAGGARVVLVDLQQGALEAAAKELGDMAIPVVADVSSESDTARYVKAAIETWSQLDILVANAAISGPVQPLITVEPAQFEKVLAVNVRGPWLGMRAAIPQMSRGASIVITSSVLGLRGVAGGAAYVASKHAITGLMKVAATEHASQGIRVNCVHPGMIETPMARDMERAISPNDPERGRAKLERSIPMQRYATPDEIAQMIVFLAGDTATYCTGGSYVVDGGQMAG